MSLSCLLISYGAVKHRDLAFPASLSLSLDGARPPMVFIKKITKSNLITVTLFLGLEQRTLVPLKDKGFLRNSTSRNMIGDAADGASGARKTAILRKILS